MVWPYASGVVAFMEDESFPWITKMYIPGKPGGNSKFRMSPHAITLGRFGTGPEPAVRCLVDTFPKAFCFGYPWPNMVALIGTIKPQAFKLSLVRQKLFATFRAGGWTKLLVRHREPPVFALSGSLWANQGLPLTLRSE